MKNITLTEASEILNKMGYEINATLTEAFNLYYYVLDDAFEITESETLSRDEVSKFLKIRSENIKERVEALVCDNDLMNETYLEIVKESVDYEFNKILEDSLEGEISIKDIYRLKRDGKQRVYEVNGEKLNLTDLIMKLTITDNLDVLRIVLANRIKELA